MTLASSSGRLWINLRSARFGQVGVLFERLKDHEEITYGTNAGVKVDLDEVEYSVRNVWCGCSAFTLAKGPHAAAKANKGLWRSTRNLTLVRWDEEADCDLGNLVLLRYDEAEAHVEGGQQSTRSKHPEAAAFIDQRLDVLKAFLHCGTTH
mmetsp:Transcript_5709/g.14703  ORF Transcript_5709/g.14703 Transcript_5709/m.14703 type:complete len:151 (-) Transcript_5709:14-466(-)